MFLRRDVKMVGVNHIPDCVKDGFISSSDMEALNDMTLLIFEAMLVRILSGQIEPKEAKHNTMKYIKKIIASLLIKEYEFIY